MKKILEKIREKLNVFTYGDGITYTELKDIVQNCPDKDMIEIMSEHIDDLFFAQFEEFDEKLIEFNNFLKTIEEGNFNKEEKIEKKNKKIEDLELVNDFIVESREGLAEFEAKLLEYEDNQDPVIINNIFRIVHTIKGSAGFLELEQLNKFAHINENLLDEIRNDKIDVSQNVIDYLFQVLDILKINFDLLNENLSTGYFPVFNINLDETENTVEKIKSGKKTEKIVEPEKEEIEIEEYEEPVEKRTHKKTESISKSIKVDINKVDFLLDNVGELIVVNNMLFQDKNILAIADKKTQNNLNQLKRISSRLQNSSMSLRMIPIANTFSKMMRVVRDNSKRLSKLIKLETSGENTEIDRNMVDKLYDPLMHMIRNSCDHGIEDPDSRKENGKNATGKINLSAYHKGGNIVIEIKDDGKGLDKDVILKKAIEKGVITENDVLEDNAIYNLIFEPGFSTAEVVSDISGRGVGMDVVKSTISSLGGRIDIETEKGKGTIFYIKLPLTLAILDGVVIRIGEERYILPAQVVEEGYAPQQENVFNMANRGEVVKIRENVYQLIRLNEFFEIESDYNEAWEGIVILVDTEREKIGLLVDEILGKQEVVIKNLGAFFKQYDFISGSAIMGDGSISLIIDSNKLI